jgi:hypothetical protein
MLFLFQKFKQRSTVKRTTKNKNWWDASFHSSEPLLLCCSAIISYFIFYPIIMPKLISMAAATKTATLSKIMFGMILGLGYFTAFYTLPQNIQAQPNSTRIVLKLILFGSLSGLLCFLFPTDLLGYAAMQHKQHRSKKLHKSIKKVLPFLQVTCGLLCLFSYWRFGWLQLTWLQTHIGSLPLLLACILPLAAVYFQAGFNNKAQTKPAVTADEDLFGNDFPLKSDNQDQAKHCVLYQKTACLALVWGNYFLLLPFLKTTHLTLPWLMLITTILGSVFIASKRQSTDSNLTAPPISSGHNPETAKRIAKNSFPTTKQLSALQPEEQPNNDDPNQPEWMQVK